MPSRPGRAGRENVSPLSRRFREVRAFTEQVAAPLLVEDQVVQTMPEVSPTKWHRAHTTWFFETLVLERFVQGYSRFRDEYHFLFNSYYQSLGDQFPRPQRGLLSRPSVAEVGEYRAYVDDQMDRFLDGPCGDPESLRLIEIGLNHEQQHQELMYMDMKHVLSMNPLSPRYAPLSSRPAASVRPLHWIEHPAGTFPIGHEGEGFSFDNERPRHEVLLRSYLLAARPALSAEYLDFIEDGGYERPELWLSDGWDIVRREGWAAPLYWRKREDQWEVFTLGGPKPLEAQEPVCHVSYYEADAFARWADARLPTEAEWEVAARQVPVEGNFAAGAVPHPRAPQGSRTAPELYGNVWRWTSSPYVAYPGYRPPSGPLGEYNGKFMANQIVLRGGSCASPDRHVRPTYRNFFYPRQRWQFAGIHLARDL